MTTSNPTCTQTARLWLAPKTRAKALAYAEERAKVSARKRWPNLVAAMKAGDEGRVAAYAAESAEARKAAWAAVRAAEKPAPKPKPASKRSRTTARIEREAVRKATGVDPLTAAAKALGVDVDALSAFVKLVRH